MSTNEAAATGKRTRSPNYPAISLREALPRITQIYEREFTHPADSDTLAKALGYSGTNGASDAVISALKKYGLLEHAGNREYKLSAGAIDICLHQKADPERVKAIRDAAFTPPLFAELHDEYGEILPSENNLRVKLIKKGFNPKSVGDVIHAYRDTLELVSEEAPEYNAADAGKSEVSDEIAKPAETRPMQQSTAAAAPAMSAAPTVVQGFPTPTAGESVLAFKISRDSEARVFFSGQVTQEAIEKLSALLDLSKDAYPTKAELEQQQAANILKSITTNPQTGKPYTEGMSQEGVENIVKAFTDAAKPREEV